LPILRHIPIISAQLSRLFERFLQELKNGYLAIKDRGWQMWVDGYMMMDHHMTDLFETTNRKKKCNTDESG